MIFIFLNQICIFSSFIKVLFHPAWQYENCRDFCGARTCVFQQLADLETSLRVHRMTRCSVLYLHSVEGSI